MALLGSDLTPEVPAAPDLGCVKRDRLAVREKLFLNGLDGLRQEERLSLEQGDAAQDEEAINGVVLVP